MHSPRLPLLPLALFALMGLLPLAAGCARSDGPGQLFSATGFSEIDSRLPPHEGRRVALLYAEIQARDQLKTQINQYRFGAQPALVELAMEDPFILAVLNDVVRTARITDRAVNQEGTASVTVEAAVTPLVDLVEAGRPAKVPAP